MKFKTFSFVLLGLSMWMLFGFVYGNNLLHLISTPSEVNEEIPEETPPNNSRSIQVALLLDTSGSMDGLLEQAKSQLWNILNELSRTQKDGEETELEIALYEYGSSQRGERGTQINQLTHFTTDMDLVSEKLFALNTSGSNEYSGLVIHKSLEELEWKNDDGLKMIYIAGNESFGQVYQIGYEESCRNAVEKGVVVNTIFCGEHNDGVRLFWQDGAEKGQGDYFSIAHNEVTVYVPTPYDDKINELNKKLNETYIPYGKKGVEKKRNQSAQDSNAANYSKSNAADRAAFKSSKKYKTDDWDLASAYKKDKAIVNNQEEMPEEYQNMTMEELEKEIQNILQERDSVQNEIRELDVKRRNYKLENAKANTKNGLEESVSKSLKKQAEKKGYKVDK